MKNTKKTLLGYLFAMLFVLGATLVGCGSDDCDDGQVKNDAGTCVACGGGGTQPQCSS